MLFPTSTLIQNIWVLSNYLTQAVTFMQSLQILIANCEFGYSQFESLDTQQPIIILKEELIREMSFHNQLWTRILLWKYELGEPTGFKDSGPVGIQLCGQVGKVFPSQFRFYSKFSNRKRLMFSKWGRCKVEMVAKLLILSKSYWSCEGYNLYISVPEWRFVALSIFYSITVYVFFSACDQNSIWFKRTITP